MAGLALALFAGFAALASIPLAAAPMSLELTNVLWSVKLESLTDSSPAIGPKGDLYFGSFDGTFYNLTRDGSVRWTFQAGREIKSSPAVAADGTIYFGSRDHHLYALGPDGLEKWRFKTGAWVDSSPALAKDGTIYFGSWDTNFFALKPDGSLAWKFATGGPVVSSPAIDAAGVIYFGSHDKKLYALAPDGTKKWEFTTGGQIVSSPALDSEEAIFFTSVDGFLYNLKPDGTLTWKLRTGGITESSPIISPDGTIYVGVNTNLWAVTGDGKRKWARDGAGEVENSALVFSDNSLCFVSRYGLILGIDPKMTLLFTRYLFGHQYATPTIGPEGVLYTPDHRQGPHFTALALDLRLAKSTWPKFRGNFRNTGNIADSTW